MRSGLCCEQIDGGIRTTTRVSVDNRTDKAGGHIVSNAIPPTPSRLWRPGDAEGSENEIPRLADELLAELVVPIGCDELEAGALIEKPCGGEHAVRP